MNIDTSLSARQTMPSAAELTNLSKDGKLPTDEKLAKVCDQFEGIMVRQILSDGLKPLLAQPLGSGAAGAGVYDYMVTDTLANGISGKNSMGISHLLQTQLSPRTPATHSDHRP